MSLFRSVSVSTLISLIGTVSSYLLTIYLARIGGIANYGEYALCLAYAAIITTLIDCASATAFSHLTIKNKGSVQLAFDIVSTARFLVYIVIIIALSISLLFDFIDIPWQTLLLVFPSFNLGILFEYKGKNINFAAIICAEKIALLVVNLVLMQLFSFGYVVYASYAIITVSSLFVQFYYHSDYIRNLQLVGVRKIVQYAHDYWPLAVISVAQLGYGNISRLIIEGKHGIEVFASVSLAFQIVALSSIFQSQVDRTFRPPLIQSIHNVDFDKFIWLIWKYIIYAVFPMLFVSMFIFMISSELVDIMYGGEYVFAGHFLKYISPLFVTVCLMRLSDHCLLSFDLIKQNLVINVSVSFLMLIILYVLSSDTPLYILAGVVVFAQFIQAVIGAVLVLYAYNKRVKF